MDVEEATDALDLAESTWRGTSPVGSDRSDAWLDHGSAHSARFALGGGSVVEERTELHLEQVGWDLRRHFARVAARGWGIDEDPTVVAWFEEVPGAPGMTTYAAFDGWEIVATAAMFVVGDTAWLWGAATVPEARGRGARSGLLARRVHDANALGVRWIGGRAPLDEGGTTGAALRNVRRLGFAVLPG